MQNICSSWAWWLMPHSSTQDLVAALLLSLRLTWAIVCYHLQKTQISALYALIIHDSIGAHKSQKPGFYLSLNVYFLCILVFYNFIHLQNECILMYHIHP